jgi:hypothetical protein
MANNGMARKWAPWVLVTAAVVGVVPAPFTAPVNAWWVAPTVAFQLVVYAAGFTLLRVPEHRRNATHLILVGVVGGAGYLLAEPIADIGYWLQLGFATGALPR